MDLDKVRELIKLVEAADISGLSIEEGDTKIEIKKSVEGQFMAMPQTAVASTPANVAAAPVAKADAHAGLTAIKSPMTGTFYAAPSPDSPPFLKHGDNVSAGQPVCIIEAMKTFNEIESDLSGVIEKILVANATPVELGQPLFLIR